MFKLVTYRVRYVYMRVAMLVNKFVYMAEYRERFTTYEHAPGTMANKNFQEFS